MKNSKAKREVTFIVCLRTLWMMATVNKNTEDSFVTGRANHFAKSVNWETGRKPRGGSCGFEEVDTSFLFLTLPLFFPRLCLSVSDIRTAATHTLRQKYPARRRTAIKYSVFSDSRAHMNEDGKHHNSSQ